MKTICSVLLLFAVLALSGQENVVVGQYYPGSGGFLLTQEPLLTQEMQSMVSPQATFGNADLHVNPEEEAALLVWQISGNSDGVSRGGLLLVINDQGELELRSGVTYKFTCKGVDGCSACDATLSWSRWRPVVSCKCIDPDGGDCQMEVTIEVDVSTPGFKK